MQSSVPYVIHAIDGRMRVKVPAVRGSSTMADAVTAQLRALDGVGRVHANQTTGSVIVHYTRGLTSSEAILDALRMAVRFSPHSERIEPSRCVACSQEASSPLTTRMLHLAMDLAVQRLLMALVP
jgi:copper chaperone CopZ